jgi:hypothetical protein
MNVADIILAQLGGNRFIAMTGAKNFLQDKRNLQFDLPRGTTKNKATRVQVTLITDKDTYTVDFHSWNGRKFEFKHVATIEDVYADNLQTVFTQHTGLYTHL